MMYPDVHFLEGEIVTVGEVRLSRRTPNATKAHLLLPELLPRSRSPFHSVKTLGRPSIPVQTFWLDHNLIAPGDRYHLGVLNLQE
jgi:hypothetical protein